MKAPLCMCPHMRTGPYSELESPVWKVGTLTGFVWKSFEGGRQSGRVGVRAAGTNSPGEILERIESVFQALLRCRFKRHNLAFAEWCEIPEANGVGRFHPFLVTGE